ncbi:phosphatidylserine decarboxylase family protein [bacterium]|nr:phosphatidylserine decarboxylase family protein [bacterium]
MAKEGYPIIFSVLIFSFAVTFLNPFIGSELLAGFSILCWIIFAWVLWFFRDPERKNPNIPNSVISPADGIVLEIKETEEPYLFKGKAKVVCVFMNVFNCHVNRVPISGEVKFFKYLEGEFLAAWDDKASEKNEQTIIGIRNEKTTIVFKQIAGLIARRIICRLKEGDKVSQSERFGLIKFGSRVDVYFPVDAEIKVACKQKVVAGETVLGVLK